jgi:hypothetical protein
VLSTAHDVGDGRLFRLVDAMERVGLAVEVVGRGDPLDGPPGAVVRTLSLIHISEPTRPY